MPWACCHVSWLDRKSSRRASCAGAAALRRGLSKRLKKRRSCRGAVEQVWDEHHQGSHDQQDASKEPFIKAKRLGASSRQLRGGAEAKVESAMRQLGGLI